MGKLVNLIKGLLDRWAKRARNLHPDDRPMHHMPGHILMISKTGCPACDAARAFLTEHGVPIRETKIEDVGVRNRMYDRLGLTLGGRTVPQFIIQADDAGLEVHIGPLAALIASGVLPKTRGHKVVAT